MEQDNLVQFKMNTVDPEPFGGVYIPMPHSVDGALPTSTTATLSPKFETRDVLTCIALLNLFFVQFGGKRIFIYVKHAE